MGEVLYFHHGSSRDHDPRVFLPEHPDTPERIDAIESALEGAGWAGCSRVQAPAATFAELELVHAPMLVGQIRRMSLSGGGQIDQDTFVGEASYTAALHAAGGACAMVRALVRGDAEAAFCGLRPSGHHAGREQAMGFCLFNNIAIAAELAIRELGLQRVFILDWDVHHGNGTAEFFRRRCDVLFASIHQAGAYPGTGAVSDIGAAIGPLLPQHPNLASQSGFRAPAAAAPASRPGPTSHSAPRASSFTPCTSRAARATSTRTTTTRTNPEPSSRTDGALLVATERAAPSVQSTVRGALPLRAGAVSPAHAEARKRVVGVAALNPSRR